MWTFSEVKEEGKQILRTCFWPSVAACLIFGFFGGGGSGISSRASSSNSDLAEKIDSLSGTDFNPTLVFAILAAVIGILLIAIVIGLAWNIFVANIVKVGCYSFFIKTRDDAGTSVGVLFDMFRSGRYKNVCKTMFMKDLFIWLWSLLLVIPGIIKKYEYFMVDYILAENPEINYEQALAISKNTMNGEKMNVFLLQLSFIGWFLASICTCGLLLIFYVNPYMSHTMAATYARLKEKALDMGYATQDNFIEA